MGQQPSSSTRKPIKYQLKRRWTERHHLTKTFTACLEKIFKKLECEGKGIRIGDEYLNNLRYVDSIVLFSESANEMQQLINDLKRLSLEIGLKLNKKKAKVMFNSRVPFEQIHVQGEALEVVHNYDLWIRNMDYNHITGEETNKWPERDGKVVVGNYPKRSDEGDVD
ncbi:uncharacterized protein [Penaeus vannamei]|uniref:uncharacterized protein n=1 Tax=Penaeus vannamei TaxID=6689 RepID=UPI00387F752E